jgi:hypothetical protein
MLYWWICCQICIARYKKCQVIVEQNSEEIDKGKKVVELDPQIGCDKKILRDKPQAILGLNKRKQMVDSDSESKSNSKNNMTLAQRNF